MERQFKGVWIPATIWENKELSLIEKHLLSEIDSFTKSGECFATNAHFAEFFQVSPRQIQRYLLGLKEKGFISVLIFYKDNSKEIEKRVIRPNYEKIYIEPHDKSGVPPRQNGYEARDSSGSTPPTKNVAGNNTYINNTNNNTKNKNNSSNSPESARSSKIENEFEQLWKIYPRKIGKKKAFDSFKKARKVKKIPYETIENGLYRYVRHLEQQETEEQFIMHGSTWFGQEKWQDEYIVTGVFNKPKNSTEYLKMKYGGENYESFRNGEIIERDPEVLSEFF